MVLFTDHRKFEQLLWFTLISPLGCRLKLIDTNDEGDVADSIAPGKPGMGDILGSETMFGRRNMKSFTCFQEKK